MWYEVFRIGDTFSQIQNITERFERPFLNNYLIVPEETV